jgi:hypothetical protein
MTPKVTVVGPNGETREEQLTPEELAKLDKQFLEDFDPKTLEPRSIQRLRQHSERKSRPSPKGENPSTTRNGGTQSPKS